MSLRIECCCIVLLAVVAVMESEGEVNQIVVAGVCDGMDMIDSERVQ